jgi:hypothetical protein
VNTKHTRPNKEGLPPKGSAVSPELESKALQVFEVLARELNDAPHPLDQPSTDGDHSWLELLEKLDQTKDPSLLLPLLDVPDHVRPHFEEMLGKRLKLRCRTGHGRSVPSYHAYTEALAGVELAVEFMRRLRAAGVAKEDRTKIASWLDVDQNRLSDALKGNLSAERRQRARRAAR